MGLILMTEMETNLQMFRRRIFRSAYDTSLNHVYCVQHKINIYLEYHSVCPLVSIGTPVSRRRVCPPGGEDTLACG
jgi:hypothetical protein